MAIAKTKERAAVRGRPFHFGGTRLAFGSVSSAPIEPSPKEKRRRLEAALVATGAEDRSAFETLYGLTKGKLFGICLRICGSRQAAEDVMAETYLTIWKRAGAYQPGRVSPITWLATIARNKSIDWKRKRGRRPQTSDEKLPELVDDAPRADDLMVADQDAAKLHLCLDKLGEDQRGAIRTAFFEGLSYSELAEREGVPLGTMKSRIRRGLISLKDCLRDDD